MTTPEPAADPGQSMTIAFDPPAGSSVGHILGTLHAATAEIFYDRLTGGPWRWSTVFVTGQVDTNGDGDGGPWRTRVFRPDVDGGLLHAPDWLRAAVEQRTPPAETAQP